MDEYKDFQKFLFIKKGLQPITVRGYVTVVRKVLRELGTLKPTIEEMDDYVYDLYRSEYSYSHKINTVLGIEQWMDFIGTPTRFGRQKKPKLLLKTPLSEAEITKMIFSCHNAREVAIITTLAYSGIRNKELCNLKVKDIDFGSNTLRITQGKGLKDRIVYVSGHCIKSLLSYLEKYPRGDDDFLFTTVAPNGKKKYLGAALRKLVKKVAKRAGFTKRVWPHLLRHSLATNMLNRGANLLTVKQQLGHVFIESTMIYIHSSEYGAKNEYEQFVPSYV
jgi:integrase/recombinase XerD